MCDGFLYVKESRTKMQRVDCDPCLMNERKTRINNKQNKELNENRNSLYLCKLTLRQEQQHIGQSPTKHSKNMAA